jgi:hypothetical protein
MNAKPIESKAAKMGERFRENASPKTQALTTERLQTLKQAPVVENTREVSRTEKRSSALLTGLYHWCLSRL